MLAGEHIDTMMRENPRCLQICKSREMDELTKEKGKELSVR